MASYLDKDGLDYLWNQKIKPVIPTKTSDIINDSGYITEAEGGDSHYEFTQATPSATWTVNHNLGKIPAITVIDSAGSEVVGSYTHTDANNTVLEFSGAFAGKAYFN